MITYVIVDDMLIKLAPLLRRPGPPPQCSDSELITMILIAECKGWDIETQLLSEFSQHPNLFPILPSQTRFIRGQSSTGFDRCSCQTLKGHCVLLIVCRFQSFSFISRLRHLLVMLRCRLWAGGIEETDHFRL